MSQTRITTLIERFNLVPHPEGGYYSEQYRSASSLASPIDGLARASVSHIYFLLTRGQVSRWHRVLHDEIWNVYEGAPLRILSLAGQKISDVIIGKHDDPQSQDFFKVITGGDYQAAQSTGEYTFVGCTVAPGFEFGDFAYIEDETTKQTVIGFGNDYAQFL